MDSVIRGVGIEQSSLALCAVQSNCSKKVSSLIYIASIASMLVALLTIMLKLSLFHYCSVEQQARPWYRPNASVEENNKAREAYRVLLTITLRKPESEEYHKFAQEVQRRAVHDYNYTYATNGVSLSIYFDSTVF